MRRSLAALVVATLSLSVLSVLAGSPSTARSQLPRLDPLAEVVDDASATAALDNATDVLSGAAADEDPNATLALRDLFVALPRLDPTERKQAQGLLARPTDGDGDEYGDGYTVPAKRSCATRICMHWVDSTRDAPPSRRWVTKTLDTMKDVWAQEVGAMGYRAPVTDRRRGGNKKFDVYLKDVGADGYYGYCVPERRKPGERWIASGYCVLDDDFARSQFGSRPGKSLRVTAAHEFFHAVQFAYDYAEDGWMMESTATWIEERVADDVNDNRQYLRYGQVSRPSTPLDLYDRQSFSQYGNWVFFEYLSQRYGAGFVRRVWENADGAVRNYSTRAVKRTLPEGTRFGDVFRAYAAANTMPGSSYAEGGSWPRAAMAREHTLTSGDPRADGTLRIDHMSSRNVLVKPGGSLRNRDWRLRISVNGPPSGTGPAALVLVHKKSGKVKSTPVVLDGDGGGRVDVAFGTRNVSRVTLTLANASTSFDCWRQQLTYSCQGRPQNDNRAFSYQVRALRS